MVIQKYKNEIKQMVTHQNATNEIQQMVTHKI